MPTAPPVPVQSVASALAVLDALVFEDAQHAGLPLTTLAQRLEMPPNTVHRLLQSLIACGYARQVDRGRYAAGPKVAAIGGQNRVLSEAGMAAVQESLARLSARLQEMVTFVALVDGRWRPVARKDADQAVKVAPAVDHPDNIYRMATGRALVAFATETVRKRIVERHGLPGARWNKIRSRRALDRACARIRERGACVIEDTGKEIVLFAVAVFAPPPPDKGNEGRLIGSLACSMPRYRSTPEKLEGMIHALQQEAEALGRRLD